MTASSADPYLMLSPAGALYAFAEREPDATAAQLQSLMAPAGALRRSTWLGQDPQRHSVLAQAQHAGWVQSLDRALQAPDTNLDNYLPHAIAGLSGNRTAALASDDGFCLARVGYSQDEADTLCVAAADFFSFVARQKARGWAGSGRAVSFF